MLAKGHGHKELVATCRRVGRGRSCTAMESSSSCSRATSSSAGAATHPAAPRDPDPTIQSFLWTQTGSSSTQLPASCFLSTYSCHKYSPFSYISKLKSLAAKFHLLVMLQCKARKEQSLARDVAAITFLPCFCGAGGFVSSMDTLPEKTALQP